MIWSVGWIVLLLYIWGLSIVSREVPKLLAGRQVRIQEVLVQGRVDRTWQ